MLLCAVSGRGQGSLQDDDGPVPARGCAGGAGRGAAAVGWLRARHDRGEPGGGAGLPLPRPRLPHRPPPAQDRRVRPRILHRILVRP